MSTIVSIAVSFSITLSIYTPELFITYQHFLYQITTCPPVFSVLSDPKRQSLQILCLRVESPLSFPVESETSFHSPFSPPRHYTSPPLSSALPYHSVWHHDPLCLLNVRSSTYSKLASFYSVYFYHPSPLVRHDSLSTPTPSQSRTAHCCVRYTQSLIQCCQIVVLIVMSIRSVSPITVVKRKKDTHIIFQP